MSLIPVDEVVHFDVTTHHPSTGAVTDADSTPTFSVFEEDTDTPIVSASNFTKRTSLTGNYRGSFTASAANGFEAGKWYNVIASATVNSIAAKGVAMRFRVAPAESSAGVPKADVSHAAGTAWNSGAIGASTLASDTITAAKIAADAITAAKIADGAIDAATFAAGAINAAAIATDAIDADALAADAIAEINATVDTAISDAALATAANLATVAGYIDTEVAAIKAKTDNLPSDPADASDIAASHASLSGKLDTIDDFLDTEIAAIKAITDALVTRTNTAQAGGAGTITLDASASAVDDFYNYQVIQIVSGTGAGQARIVSDYDGSTKVATVNGNWATTPDNTSVFALRAFGAIPGATAPTVTEIRQEMDANSTQLAAILADTAEIGVAGAGLTNINLPNQTMDIVGNITGNLSGSVGSVTGAVGSVTGNVGGNVTGSVGSVASGGIAASSFAAGAIDAAAIAADAIGSSELAASAITEIQAGLSTLDAAGIRTAVGLASANLDTQLTAIDDYLDTEVAAIKAKTDNLPSDPADASDIAASHASLASTLSTIAGYLDTEIAAIKAVTDQFTAAQSEPSAVPAANATPLAKIAWLAALARNRVEQTATTQTLRADDGSTAIATATVSDDGSTFVRGEFA